MLEAIGYKSMDTFIDAAIPPSIRLPADALSDHDMIPLSETELSVQAQAIAALNRSSTSFIGLGYHQAKVPAVIQRNLFENPVWYTSYTPYQPEIAQGRLGKSVLCALGMADSLRQRA
jgi:glycine dehydrogenase